MEKELFNSSLTKKRNAAKYLIIAVFSYLLAMTTLFTKASPFSAALIGSLNGFGCVVSALSSALALLINGQLANSVPTLVALASIAIIRLFLGKNRTSPLRVASSFLTACAVLLTNLVTAAAPADIILSAVFAIIAGVTSFSLTVLYKIVTEKRSVAMLKPSHIAAIGIVTVFAIAAFSSVKVNVFNIGAIMSAVIICVVTSKFRYSGGAVFGIVCAFGMAIAGDAYISSGIILCVAGIVSALLTPHGKILQTASFVLASAVAAAALGINNTTLAFIADVLVGGVTFMLLPVNELMKKLQPREKKPFGSSPSEVFAGRLSLVANTISTLRYAMEKTAETLDKGNVSDVSSVYNSACDCVCRNCRYNMQCWGDEYNESTNEMNRIIQLLKQGADIEPETFHGLIAARCSRKKQLSDELNARYKELVGARQAARKVNEMRAVLSAQLVSTERMFEELSQEFNSETNFDTAASIQLEEILERFGLTNPKAAVRTVDGNITIEAYGDGELAVSAEELGDCVIEAFQREFDLPDIMSYDGKVRITMFERACYAVKTAKCQYSRVKDASCGDFVDTYIDGKGFAYVILSDGMGSGARARIDSAFACSMLIKLLESGVSIESAVGMLNTSLLVKSSDESFATLDICKIDLYTGKVNVYKAGGSDTFVKAGKKVIKLEGYGFPVGISFAVSMENKSFTISENDIVILTSDGAKIPTNWLEQLFEKDSAKDLNELVKTIAANAKFSCERGREDDISVVAVQLCK